MTAEKLLKYIPHFKDIYADGKEVNPIPENVKLTVYCEGSNFDDRGFIENATTREMGMEIFIAKKWILQSELETLAKSANSK